MKITIEIPDWAKERHIYVFAGIEMLAYKHVGESLKIKVSRCSMCGKCCERIGCQHLKKNGDKFLCGLNLGRPFSCCLGGSATIPECTEIFNVI